MSSAEIMDVPTLSTISCPHCYVENPIFESQRCNSCQLTMFSDQELHLIQQTIQPQLKQLQEDLLALSQTPHALGYLRSIQPNLNSLAPLGKNRKWLETYISGVDEFLVPFQNALDRFKRQFLIHLLFFFVLLMAPMMAFFLGANAMISSLLFLPVLGWGYLGMWKYTGPLRQGATTGKR